MLPILLTTVTVILSLFWAHNLSLALAWAYARYGRLPEVGAILYGIKPAVIGIIATAAYRLGRSAVTDRKGAAFCVAVLAASLLRADDVMLLVAAGLLMVALSLRPRGAWLGLLVSGGLPIGAPIALPRAVSERLVSVFLYFLKVGAVLYGSGLVLYAFIERDVVARFQWLTPQQLVDAIAAGQVTPGPVLSSATFIGYLIAGPMGAGLATLGVFFPSFVIVALIGPWIGRLRHWQAGKAFLQGATIAAVALIVKTGLFLGRAALVDLPTVLIALASLLLLWRRRVDAIWVIAGGAALGLGRLLLAA